MKERVSGQVYSAVTFGLGVYIIINEEKIGVTC